MESYDNSHGPTKEAAQLLEMPIARAAHAAKKIVESRVADQILAGSTLNGKKRSPFFFDLQKAIEDMEFVRRKATKLSKAAKLKTNSVAKFKPSSSSTPPTSERSMMVGFDDVLLRLLDLLTGHPSTRRVIPITGTGGIGKTTLAKNAFQHSLIVEQFDVRLWDTISQQYAVEDILLTLLSRQNKPNNETVGDLKQQLHKMLYARRYLVVLDDMWSVEAWDEIKFCFPDTSNGSRVVVTTRQSYISDCIGSSRLSIDFLDEEKSWDLFLEKTFGVEGCPLELEDVGKEIVKRCSGLPLAIIVVAGHLRNSTRIRGYWENVANNMKLIYNSDDNKEFLDILSFSYSFLPCSLKPCFIYMATYGEDEFINVESLIELWIGEGLIRPSKSKTLEEIGQEYLKDLIDRNLVFDTSENYVGMHDMLRELCIKIAQKERFFHVFNCSSVQLKEGDLRLLRVLVQEQETWVNEAFLEGDLEQVNLGYVNYTIDNNDVCRSISPPLSLLWNLQTLIISIWQVEPCVAPLEFWKMMQVRNVVVKPGIYLPDPSDNSDKVMSNLQKLLCAVNLKVSEDICKRIPNLKKLGLRYDISSSEFPTSSSYYCLHNLCKFHKLESLDCRFSESGTGLKYELGEFGWSFKLPNSLKKLTISGCRLNWEDVARILGSLQHLKTLFLDYQSVIGSDGGAVEDKFARLKYLYLWNCEDLVEWNVDSSNFPALEYISIVGVSRLEVFPCGLGEIPSLGCIHLGDGISDSLLISAARVVMESQEELGNEDLQLQISGLPRPQREWFNKKLQEEGLTINNLIFM